MLLRILTLSKKTVTLTFLQGDIFNLIEKRRDYAKPSKNNLQTTEGMLACFDTMQAISVYVISVFFKKRENRFSNPANFHLQLISTPAYFIPDSQQLDTKE